MMKRTRTLLCACVLSIVAAVCAMAFTTPASASAHEDFGTIGNFEERTQYVTFTKSSNINRAFTAEGLRITFACEFSAGSGDFWSALDFTSTAAAGNNFSANIPKSDGIGIQMTNVEGKIRFNPFQDGNKAVNSPIPVDHPFTLTISGNTMTFTSTIDSSLTCDMDVSGINFAAGDGTTYVSAWIYSAADATPAPVRVYDVTAGEKTYLPTELVAFGSSFNSFDTSHVARAEFSNLNLGLDKGLKAADGVSVTLFGNANYANTSGDWYNVVFASEANHGSFGNNLAGKGIHVRVGEAAGYAKLYIGNGTPASNENLYYTGDSIPNTELTQNNDGLRIQYGQPIRFEIRPLDESYGLYINDILLTTDGTTNYLAAHGLDTTFMNAQGETFLNFACYYSEGDQKNVTTIQLFSVTEGNTVYTAQEMKEMPWTCNTPSFYVAPSFIIYQHGGYNKPLNPVWSQITLSIGNNNAGDVFKMIGLFNKLDTNVFGAYDDSTAEGKPSGVYFLVRYDGGTNEIYFCLYSMPGVTEVRDDNGQAVQLRYGISPNAAFRLTVKKADGAYGLYVNDTLMTDSACNNILTKYFADNNFIDANGHTWFVVGSNNIDMLPVTIYDVEVAARTYDLSGLQTRDGAVPQNKVVKAFDESDTEISCTEENGVYTCAQANVRYFTITADGYETLRYDVRGTTPLMLELAPYNATVTVKDEDGAPITGATVKAQSQYYDDVAATEENGVYTLTGVRGEATVAIEKNGYVATQQVTLDKDNASQQVTLQTLYTASVTVKDEGGTPIENATVTASFGGGVKTFTHTGDGVYTLANVYGALTAAVSANGYTPNNDVSLDKDNASEEVTLTETTYSVTVNIVDGDGNPVVGATVKLTKVGGAEVTATAGEDGVYTASNLTGEYTVTATKDGYTVTSATVNKMTETVMLTATKNNTSVGPTDPGDKDPGDKDPDDTTETGDPTAGEPKKGCKSAAGGTSVPFAGMALVLAGGLLLRKKSRAAK